jgi:hypothetical protein
MGNKLKDHHYNKLPNFFFMDHIFEMFSFLTSLLTSYFFDFLQEAFGIHKLFMSQSIINLLSCCHMIKSCTGCEPGGLPPKIKCFNANSKNTTPNILLQHNKKNNQEMTMSQKPKGSSSFFAIEKKPTQDNDDKLKGSLLSYVTQ